MIRSALLLLAATAYMAAPAASAAATMPPALADLAQKVLPSVVSIASTDPVTGNQSDDNGDDNDNGDGNDNGNDNGGGSINPDDPNGGGDNGDNGDAGDGGNGAAGSGAAFHATRADATTSAAGTVLPPPKAEEALGSGFVFDPSGYILTNNHVIAGASSVTVTFQDGTILPATVVGRDKDGDLAVLKVQAAHKLAAVPFGDSGTLRVGDWVLAVGNPFGLPGSTSAGIVSALHRDIGANKFDDFIQTDAAINRGNSGGPLFDMTGHVIGVNSEIYSPSGGSAGIGFAIPAAMAAPVAAELVKSGVFARGWLGVSAQEVTPEIAALLGLPHAAGALVGGVAPHAPANGTLRAGDTLVGLGGTAIATPRDLLIRTAEASVGSALPIKFWRNGALQTATLRIAAPPAVLDATQTASPVSAPALAIAPLGLAVSTAAAASGLQVVAVTHGGPAATAGLAAQDTVEQLGGSPVGTAADFQAAVSRLAAAKIPAVLLISGDAPDGNDPGPRWMTLVAGK